MSSFIASHFATTNTLLCLNQPFISIIKFIDLHSSIKIKDHHHHLPPLKMYWCSAPCCHLCSCLVHPFSNAPPRVNSSSLATAKRRSTSVKKGTNLYSLLTALFLSLHPPEVRHPERGEREFHLPDAFAPWRRDILRCRWVRALA